MSINAISAAMSASVYVQASGNKLPDWLLDKLVDLGISTENVTSTSQAQALITKAEESGSDTESNDNNQNAESDDLRDRAMDLAEKVGVKVRNNDTADDILDNIKNLIDKVIKNAIDDNDEALFNKMKNYQIDLNNLIAESNGGGISNSIVYSFMDMVADQNKYSLGLNKK